MRSWISFALAWVVVASACLVVGTPANGQATEDLELKPGVSGAGVGFYRPHTWGLVRSMVANAGASEATGLLAVTTRGSGAVQFAKEVWVPPGSQLQVVTPIRLDRLPSDLKGGVAATASFIGEVNGREAVRDSDEGVLNAREGGFQTALMRGAGADALATMSVALRESAGLPPTTAGVTSANAPRFAPAWDAIQLFILGDPSAELDADQKEALRRFVFGGGRLWVDLTRVDPELMRDLLGDHWNVAVIDRVGRTAFAIEGAGGTTRVEVDYPVDQVRVIAPEMETLHTVEGYPASLRKAVGAGTLLVTTLEPEAWLAGGKATPSLRSLTWLVRETDRVAEATDVRTQVLQAVASEQIGYSVIGRGPVAIVLAGFTLVLLGTGVWFARQGDLARMGWVAPVLATVAAAVLLGVGLARQSEVPFTLAEAEIVEVAAGTPYAKVNSLVSVYTPWGAARGDAALRGVGEPAWPDLQTHAGQNVRVVWTGDRRWRFDNLPLREGAVQTAQREVVVALESPLAATVRLTPEGLEGRVETGGLGELQDAVILTPDGKLTVAAGADGAFHAPAVDPLGPSQYFPGTLLGQRQMARQEVYRQLVADRRFPERPVLAGWAERTTGRIEVSESAEERNRGLVIVPLTVQPPQAGERIAVPAPLMTMHPYRGNRELMSAPIYDERSREWVPAINNAQTALMAFEPPRGVGRLKVETARVELDLIATGRPVEIVIYENGRVRSVYETQSPAGQQVIELAGGDVPQPLADGSIVVGVRVGDPIDPLSAEAWSMKRLELGVTAVAE